MRFESVVEVLDGPAGPGQHQGRGKAGGTPADDCDVELVHVFKAGDVRPVHLSTLLFLGKPSQMSLVDDMSATRIATALEKVGGRLKGVRTNRGMTLTGVSTTTGISKSTLSRLETGQRRPILELLLALAHAYRVPLYDLVEPRRRAAASNHGRGLPGIWSRCI